MEALAVAQYQLQTLGQVHTSILLALHAATLIDVAHHAEDAAERERAAALMDRWTAGAEAVDQRWRDQLLEHKDAWSAIIRTAHETRLADPRDDDARGVSEQIVRQDGPTV